MLTNKHKRKKCDNNALMEIKLTKCEIKIFDVRLFYGFTALNIL